MDRTRLSLDNPAFAGRLRQSRRSPVYVSRPTPAPAKVIDDIIAPTASKKTMPTQAQSEPAQVIRKFIIGQDRVSTVAAGSPHPEALPSSLKPRHQPQKSLVLRREAVQPSRLPQIAEASSNPERKRPTLLYAMAAVVFIVGLAVSLNGLRANRQVAAQVKHLSSKSNSSTDNPPSTQKPSASSIANYVVAPNLPRYIDIPKLEVHARVLSLGILKNGALATPGNVFDTGWYNASAQPGKPGAMLVDGHISSWTTKGVFYGLNKLVVGDTIKITRGDGQIFTYVVAKSAVVDAKQVDMASMLVSADTAKPGLNLISCSGDVIPGTNEFDKRVTVYAVMQ